MFILLVNLSYQPEVFLSYWDYASHEGRVCLIWVCLCECESSVSRTTVCRYWALQLLRFLVHSSGLPRAQATSQASPKSVSPSWWDEINLSLWSGSTKLQAQTITHLWLLWPAETKWTPLFQGQWPQHKGYECLWMEPLIMPPGMYGWHRWTHKQNQNILTG